MRIVHFAVSNYRSIGAEQVLDGLGAFEVLHGPNNAGKSNLLAAMDLTVDLLGEPGWATTPDGEPRDEIELTSRPSLRAPLLHRGASSNDRIGLEIRTEDPAWDARFELRVEPGTVVARRVRCTRDGADWRPRSASPTRAVAGGPRFRDATEETPPPRHGPFDPFVLLTDVRRAPEGAPSWDVWLLREKDRGDEEGRARWDAVEGALRTLVEELGPGELERVATPPRGIAGPWARYDGFELAWQPPSGDAQPFSEQGSGVRHLKDVLIATLGTPASVVALEEPEVHLSEVVQLRVREILRGVAEQGAKQIFATSHVYAFDGEEVWRVRRDEERATRVEPKRLPSRPELDPALPEVERQRRRLAAVWPQLADLAPGFVSEAGFLQLPEPLRRRLGTPGWFTFGVVGDGRFIGVSEDLLRDDGGEE